MAKQCGDVSPKKAKTLEVVADVTKKEDLKRLMDKTIKTFAKLDILVNNAGAAIATDATESDFFDNFQKVIDINLNSVVYLTHLSVKHLEKTKGNIINISSICGIRSVSQTDVNNYDDLIVIFQSSKNLHHIVWPKLVSICSRNAWQQSWDQKEFASMLSSNLNNVIA